MGQLPYYRISGTIVVIGKHPDGDSVRFKPDDSAQLQQLQHGRRLRVATDGTVQLRLDAIDAPEVHYQGQAQPLGTEARSKLLQTLEFTDVRTTIAGKVLSAEPTTRPGVIITKMVEVHGRPVSYLFTKANPQLHNGQLAISMLQDSTNAAMLRSGLAYPTLYTSTPVAHRELFVALAARARTARRGVWTVDSTARFRLDRQATIGPQGQLILPKLFRRCTDYLRFKANGSTKTFLQWLSQAMANDFPEDDELFVGTRRTRLSKIIRVTGNNIDFVPDLLDVVFIEKR